MRSFDRKALKHQHSSFVPKFSPEWYRNQSLTNAIGKQIPKPPPESPVTVGETGPAGAPVEVTRPRLPENGLPAVNDAGPSDFGADHGQPVAKAGWAPGASRSR